MFPPQSHDAHFLFVMRFAGGTIGAIIAQGGEGIGVQVRSPSHPHILLSERFVRLGGLSLRVAICASACFSMSARQRVVHFT